MLRTGEARRRLLADALRAPPAPPTDGEAGAAAVVPECDDVALACAGRLGLLSPELVVKIFASLARFESDPRLGAAMHASALEAAEDVHRAALVCKYALWVFRSACGPLRLEVVARMCTALTPGSEKRERQRHPYYHQVLREERSRHHLRLFEGAINALVCHCTGEHCMAARRNHNLTISAPSQPRSEVLRRAVGEQRPRVKVMWRIRSRSVAPAAEASSAAVLLETDDVAVGPHSLSSRAAAIATLASSLRRPPALFGPAGYLSNEFDQAALERAVSGVLVVETAARSESTAHFESCPTHAVPLLQAPPSAGGGGASAEHGAAASLSVTQLRLSACGGWLVTVAATIAKAAATEEWPAGRAEVRVFALRRHSRAVVKGQLVETARLGGLAEDQDEWAPYEAIGRSAIDAWFFDGAASLAIMDCSDARRGETVVPDNGGHGRHPVLRIYTRATPDANFVEARRVPTFARIPGWNDRTCDHSVIHSTPSSSGAGYVAIWGWLARHGPTRAYGCNVQHYDLRSNDWQHVSGSRFTEALGPWIPRQAALTPHSDIVVLLLRAYGAHDLRIETYARQATGNRTGAYDVCAEREFASAYALVRRVAVSSVAPSITAFCAAGGPAVSPCGRFVLYIFRSAVHKSSAGGVYVIDLGEAPEAGAMQSFWIPALSYALPTRVAWSDAGLWLQTHQGVLLVS
jgi:hypothetical protein